MAMLKTPVQSFPGLGLPALAALGLYVALSPRLAIPLYTPRLFQPEKTLVDEPFQCLEDIAPRDVNFLSSNGKQLHGWHFKQPGATKTILWHHGNSGNISHRAAGISLLLKSRASVFIYDYQGFGRSEGTPSIQGICDDGKAALKHLLTEETLKENQIVHYGESLGSAVACRVAAGSMAAGLILQSAFSSLRRIGQEILPFVRIYPSWLFPQPDLNNVAIVRKNHPPLLIIHGLKDDYVSYAHSEYLYKMATGPKTLVGLPQASHSNIAETDPERFLEAVKTFLGSLR